MRWPFVSRGKYDGSIGMLKMNVNLLNEIIEVKNQIITEQMDKLKAKDVEIQALVAQLSDPKCNALHSEAPSKPKKDKTSSVVLPIRGGWRGMSEQYSKATIPTGSDSMQQLEQRVEAQGGTK